MFEAIFLAAASTRRGANLLKRYWATFQEWRTRQRLRSALHDLNDRELTDIGIARGEIDYIAANGSVNPPLIRPPAIYTLESGLPRRVKTGNALTGQKSSA